MSSAAVNVNGSGDNTIVAAPVNNAIIRVIGFSLIPTAAVTVTWKSGTGGGATALAGPVALTAPGWHPARSVPFAGGYNSASALFDTAPGQALNLNLGANVQVGGFVDYLVVPT